MTNNQPLFIAHRGESKDAPENSLAAINLAWQRDDDAVEIDVHLSKDKKIVVIHDDNTIRFTGQNKLVKDQTLEELRQIDIGKHKGLQWLGEQIPTLEQVLQTVPGGKSLFIEIKSGTEILPIFQDEFGKSGLHADQIKLISFNLEVLSQARQFFPGVEISLVADIRHLEAAGDWQVEISKLIEKVSSAGLHGLDLSASPIIDKSLGSFIKSAGLKLYIWTENDPLKAKKLLDAGVDGITTDHAFWLKRQVVG